MVVRGYRCAQEALPSGLNSDKLAPNTVSARLNQLASPMSRPYQAQATAFNVLGGGKGSCKIHTLCATGYARLPGLRASFRLLSPKGTLLPGFRHLLKEGNDLWSAVPAECLHERPASDATGVQPKVPCEAANLFSEDRDRVG